MVQKSLLWCLFSPLLGPSWICCNSTHVTIIPCHLYITIVTPSLTPAVFDNPIVIWMFDKITAYNAKQKISRNTMSSLTYPRWLMNIQLLRPRDSSRCRSIQCPCKPHRCTAERSGGRHQFRRRLGRTGQRLTLAELRFPVKVWLFNKYTHVFVKWKGRWYNDKPWQLYQHPWWVVYVVLGSIVGCHRTYRCPAHLRKDTLTPDKHHPSEMRSIFK